MEPASDPELEEEPDVWELFRHYDQLYFQGALADAAFAVEWTSPRLKTSSGFGSCSIGKMGKTITLYKPMLQHHTKADLKNALLHLMIHAIIFVKHGLSRLSWHGAVFRDWMDAINACSIEDYLRPQGGYCITTTHDFSLEELQSIQGNLWKCTSCAATLLRATKLGPPSDSCCIENVRQHPTCGNMLCNWHNHKMKCGGKYVVPARGQKMVPKGYAVGCKRGLLTETSETSGSQDAEDCQKAIVLAPPRSELKLKQEFVASEKHEFFNIGKCNNAKSLGSWSSNKADDFQKAIVPSASPLSKLKWKQKFVASEKQELTAVESFYDTKLASRLHKPEHVQKSNVQPAASQKRVKLGEDLRYGSSMSRKAKTWHKPEDVEKPIAMLPPPPKRRRLDQDLVDKRGDTKPLGGRTGNKEGKLPKPEGMRIPIARPAAPQSILKQQNKANSSTKAEKQHNSRSKLKQSDRIALERQKTAGAAAEEKRTRSAARERKRRRSAAAPGKKKEYACAARVFCIYESECSSGSAEPLVNKRTERRKRERERAAQIACGGISSVKARPAEEEVSSQQPKPPPQSQCLDVILIGAAVEVATPGPRDRPNAPSTCMDMVVVPPADNAMTHGQSQPPAQCMDIVMHQAPPVHESHTPAACSISTVQVVTPHSADPDVIDISDDD